MTERHASNEQRRVAQSHPEPIYTLRPGTVTDLRSRRMPRQTIQMRKLKYHVNTSADGFILSDVKGLGDIAGGEEPSQYLRSLHAYGVALMGWRTYEAMRALGFDDPYPHLMSYVFSRTCPVKAAPQVEVVSTEACEWIGRMKACPGKDLYLCGGASLATSLFQANLIDEVVLKVNPILVGSGRRLLSEIEGRIKLSHNTSFVHQDGAVILTYQVQTDERRVVAA